MSARQFIGLWIAQVSLSGSYDAHGICRTLVTAKARETITGQQSALAIAFAR